MLLICSYDLENFLPISFLELYFFSSLVFCLHVFFFSFNFSSAIFNFYFYGHFYLCRLCPCSFETLKKRAVALVDGEKGNSSKLSFHVFQLVRNYYPFSFLLHIILQTSNVSPILHSYSHRTLLSPLLSFPLNPFFSPLSFSSSHFPVLPIPFLSPSFQCLQELAIIKNDRVSGGRAVLMLLEQMQM